MILFVFNLLIIGMPCQNNTPNQQLNRTTDIRPGDNEHNKHIPLKTKPVVMNNDQHIPIEYMYYSTRIKLLY